METRTFTYTTCVTIVEWNEGHRKLNFVEIAKLLSYDYNYFMKELQRVKDSGLYENARSSIDFYGKYTSENPIRMGAGVLI